MALPGALRLWLACLLLSSAAPKPTCDPSACGPCPEGDPEGTASPAAGGCCPPCPPPCPCPPYLHDDCDMQGFSSVPAGRSFYIDFGRKLCTCGPGGDIACTPLCPSPGPACLALGSPRADGCPQCVCYDQEEMAVPAGTVTIRGSQRCSCPEQGGELLCTSGSPR
ncbi:fibulin-2-like [Parus major]|uniref:fibulin-2-like n=1 Tax=Parus major TaxID=9157 RepID=UPI0007712F3B|nr:fibulin-2-like [Parus major]